MISISLTILLRKSEVCKAIAKVNQSIGCKFIKRLGKLGEILYERKLKLVFEQVSAYVCIKFAPIFPVRLWNCNQILVYFCKGFTNFTFPYIVSDQGVTSYGLRVIVLTSCAYCTSYDLLLLHEL